MPISVERPKSGSSVYTINETESAVITTFGKATLIEKKGLHFKIPFIQHLTKVDTSIQDVEPPTESIIEAFTAVETAKQSSIHLHWS